MKMEGDWGGLCGCKPGQPEDHLKWAARLSGARSAIKDAADAYAMDARAAKDDGRGGSSPDLPLDQFMWSAGVDGALVAAEAASDACAEDGGLALAPRAGLVLCDG